MKFLLKVILSCIGILYSISLSAQNNASGRIVDEQNKGIDAAVVMLISLPDSILIETTLTDDNGDFQLPEQTGHFLLYIRALGYKEFKKDITITASEILPTIQLEADNVVLKDVVVTARKSRPLTSLSNGKLQINVAQTYLTDIGNALDVLKHSPGISVNSKGDISLATLGGTAIYINGKKLMLQGEELSAYLRSLPSSKITRIESSTNPNASFGTDGAGGVINIILKSNERTGTFLTTSHSLSYWKNIRQNSDISFSFNKSKWQ